jgi:hypothetical protein
MEFNVVIDTRTADLARIDEALRDVDPAALVDAEPDGLRIAGAFDISTLSGILREAGCDLSGQDIVQVPSVCCGGCGG